MSMISQPGTMLPTVGPSIQTEAALRSAESTTLTPAAKKSSSRSFTKKRLELRDRFWPGAEAAVWSRKKSKGFSTIPRTLPLFLRLLRHLSKKGQGNPANVYCDLWCRVFDEGLVRVTDDQELAYASRYSGTRAVRTWREHIQRLVDLGFILTQEHPYPKSGEINLHSHLLTLGVVDWHRKNASRPKRRLASILSVFSI